jgi:membrane protein
MWLLAPLRLVYRVGRRFTDERCAQTAAALSFATLLALVPMIAVAVALISHFPFGAELGGALQKFLLTNLLPEKAGLVIAKYVGQFAHRTERITLIGMFALGVTALMQMLTIEHAFNAIWKIRTLRPLVRRVFMHSLALLLGPLLFGSSLLAITYLASASMGLLNEPPWVAALVGKGLSFVVTTALFGLLYWGVPNKPILRDHAIFGGAVAALGFVGLQQLFALYVIKLPNFTVLYGGFSAIPVFLAWIYASWGVILIGALIVAELPRAGKA